MGRTLKILLTNEQRLELEDQYKTGDSHSFRQRCRMILLKASGKLTKDICQIVGIKSQNQINIWIRRYKSFNIKTLKNFLKVLTADTNDLDVM